MKERKKEYLACQGDIVIGIGSWRDWVFIYEKPKKLGKKVFPWLVSDDKVLNFVAKMNRAPVIFTTSKFCKKTFIKAGVKKEKIEIIYEGIDTDFWKPLPERKIKKIREILELEKNKVILLTIGGDGTSKGAQETF